MKFRNLLPANVADGTDSLSTTTGFNNVGTGTVLSSDSTFYYSGSKSLKTVTPNNLGAGSGGFITDKVNVKPLTTYIISLKLKNSNLVRLKIKEYNSSNTEIGGVNSSTIPTSNDFTGRNLVYTTSATGAKLAIRVDGEYANTSVTIYTDELQLEEGSVATNWMPGNLLTYNQQSVETDLTGLARGQSNCTATMSRVTTDYFTGSASSQVNLDSITTTPYYFVNGVSSSVNYYAPATPGKTYLFMVSAKYKKNNHTNPIRIFPRIVFLNSSLGWVLTKEASAITITDNQWIKTYVMGTCPATGIYAYPTIRTQTNDGVVGDKLYWDDAWLIDYTPFILGNIESQESITNIILNNNLKPTSINNIENLLSYNQQTVETDLTGLLSWVENNGTGTFVRDTNIKYSGNASAKLTSNYNGSQSITIGTDIIQDITLGKRYYASTRIRNSVSNGGYFMLRFKGEFGGVISGVQEWYSIGTDWTSCEISGVAPEGAISCDVQFNCVQNQGESIYWDDAWLYLNPIADIILNNNIIISMVESGEIINDISLLNSIICEAIETYEDINDIIVYVYYKYLELIITNKNSSVDIEIKIPETNLEVKSSSCDIGEIKW